MSNGQHTYDLIITVHGSPLNPSVKDMLISMLVDDSTEQADVFELRFRDTNRTVHAEGMFTLGAPVVVKVKTGDSAMPVTLMEGEVTTIEAEYEVEIGSVAIIRGFDKSHKLFRGRKNANFKMMKASDIVSKIARENGLTAMVDATTTVYQHVSQANESDWQFLKRLADQSGRTLTGTGGKLHFKRPGSRSAPIAIDAGENLLGVRMSLTTNEQVSKVVTRSYDPLMQTAVTSQFPVLATVSTPGMPLPLAAALSKTSGDYLSSDQRLSNMGEATAVAMALAQQIAEGYVDLHGETFGDPKLRAGAKIKIDGMGMQFNGTYQVTSTRHVVRGNDSYTTEFAVTGPRDDSVLGLTETAAPGPDRIHGVMVAEVTDNNDPQKLGRVKVKIPSLGNTFETNWAIVLYPGAGKERGLQLVPEVGDHVLVAFEQGDVNYPYVLGSFYTSRQMPPHATAVTSGKVAGRKLAGQNGDFILIDQTTGKENITLSSKDGKVKVTVNTGGKHTVQIDTDMDVVVNAGKDANVKASGNVNVESQGNTKVKASGQMAIESAAALSLKGATVKIEASGPVEVKGAVIKLN